MSLRHAALLLLVPLVACSSEPEQPDPDTGTVDTDVADDTDVTETDTDADTSEDTDTVDNDVEPDTHEDTSVDTGPPVLDRTLIAVDDALAYVDPFIGSGGLGFGYASLSPAVQTPFGMVRVGPDTTNNGVHVAQNHFSGYYHGDPHLRGFSHTHFMGTGAADYGQVRLLPVAELTDELPPARFVTYADEIARPGYYAVTLPDEGVDVAITAAAHGAVHRYSFAEPGGTVLFDLSSSVTDEGAEAMTISLDGARFSGEFTYDGAFVGRTRAFTIYVEGEWSVVPSDAYTWTDDGYAPGTAEATGVHGGGVFVFDDAATVELRIGLSYVDAEQALAHLEGEVAGSFEEVEAANVARWREIFERVRIGVVDEVVATRFFTALYNAYRMPTQFSGVDGRYRGLDGEVHEADGFTYLTDLSLWDTFRTLHPWLILTDPESQRDSLRSLTAMFNDAGAYPRWPAALSFTGSMLGDPADQLFAGSALKDIDGIDYEAAFDGLLLTASTPPPDGVPFGGRGDIEAYVELGYVPAEEDDSVSLTVEYAWSDWALANLAEYLGRTEEEAIFRERGRNFQNVFHPERQFLLPRFADGTWEEGISVTTNYQGSDGPFVEGSAWQWRWYGSYDPETLVGLYESPEVFHTALTDLFDRSNLGSSAPISHLLPGNYYWHGNEPDLHAVYLFHAVDAYDELAYWVRQIQTRLYGSGPDGLPGNDDGGTLSAWYLFNALGFYPIAGTDVYYLSSPLVPYAELTVTDGSTLIIEAAGAPDRYRVGEVTIDGAPVEQGAFTHRDLYGATLQFEMLPTEGE